MAFGEQAALVGLCELIQPKLAIEIGTFQGGSLSLIAPRCEIVHTLDLVEHTDVELRNVHYHRGDSAVELPRLLSELETAGASVDFALVDGDHSRAGVARDARTLFRSSAVDRAAIVFHDAANEDVRAGIRDALQDIDGVAYANLSFVAPPHRAGVMGEIWGGLGLVVVDRRGTLWPHRRRVDDNVAWPTAVQQSRLWSVGRPARQFRRRVAYALRPSVRRIRGTRGVK